MGEDPLSRRRLSDDVGRAWRDLPPDSKEALRRSLGSLPDDLKSWRGLIDRAIDHLRQVVEDVSSVAIIGPANVGKSTLYNQLLRSGETPAEVSAVPGTTRRTQRADAGLFEVLDTPGADAPGAVGSAERQRALQAAREADVLVVLFDAAHGIRGPEQQLMGEMRALAVPTVVALNKMDLIAKGERPTVRGRAAAALGLDAEQILEVSAKEATGLTELLIEIARKEPAILGALGAALPAYRWQLAQSAIGRAASTAAAIAVTPLPIVDFLPLIGVQAAMVLTIAKIYDYRLDLRRARELIATFGAGLLGRTLFYELSKFGGPPGWLVAAAVAVGTTAALGYAAAVWFEQGTRLSRQRIREISQTVGRSIVERLKDLGRRRPDRRSLRDRIEAALRETPTPAPGRNLVLEDREAD